MNTTKSDRFTINDLLRSFNKKHGSENVTWNFFADLL